MSVLLALVLWAVVRRGVREMKAEPCLLVLSVG